MEGGSQISTDAKTAHRIEMLMLAILHISAWGCLIKSDYNFVFIIFAYFYIVSRKDSVSLTIIFYLIILLLIMDLIFYLFVTPSWMATQQKNSVWNGLKGAHGFAIFCSVLITILKAPLVWLLNSLRKSVDMK